MLRGNPIRRASSRAKPFFGLSKWPTWSPRAIAADTWSTVTSSVTATRGRPPRCNGLKAWIVPHRACCACCDLAVDSNVRCVGSNFTV